MKNRIISIAFILTSIVAYGQNDSIGVFVLSDDSSPFMGYKRHMWVGHKNPIGSTYNGSEEFIKVWTDNGSVDSGSFYMTDYCITPVKKGKVNVYSIQQVWTGKRYDTVTTENSFIAIVQPKLSLKVIKDNFKKDSTIQLIIIDRKALKPVGKRYQVGCLYEPAVYNNKGKLVGLARSESLTIDLGHGFNDRLTVKSGYWLKIRIIVRDMETDLLIVTDEISYILN